MSSGFTIRLAQASDLPQLRAISEAVGSAARWTQPQWLAIFQTEIPARLAWIAQAEIASDEMARDGMPAEAEMRGVGFLVAQDGGPDWELENIAVLPDYRRRGVGHALLSALLAQASSRQAERILLEVRASNQSAIHFYTASGFQHLALRREYYQHPPEDAQILVHTF